MYHCIIVSPGLYLEISVVGTWAQVLARSHKSPRPRQTPPSPPGHDNDDDGDDDEHTYDDNCNDIEEENMRATNE